MTQEMIYFIVRRYRKHIKVLFTTENLELAESTYDLEKENTPPNLNLYLWRVKPEILKAFMP